MERIERRPSYGRQGDAPTDVVRELMCLHERIDELVSVNMAAEQRNRELHDKVETFRLQHYHVDRRMAMLENNFEQLTTEHARFNRYHVENRTQTNFIRGPTHMQALFGGGLGLFK